LLTLEFSWSQQWIEINLYFIFKGKRLFTGKTNMNMKSIYDWKSETNCIKELTEYYVLVRTQNDNS